MSIMKTPMKNMSIFSDLSVTNGWPNAAKLR